MFGIQYPKRYSSSASTQLEEFNKLKIKLHKTEEKLDKLVAGMEKDKKLKMVKELTSTADGKFRSERTRILLKVPEFTKLAAHQEEFAFRSDAVDVAGFQWKLGAKSKNFGFGSWLELYLLFRPPAHYNGTFELDVTSSGLSFRLLNVSPDQDINKHGTIKFKHDVDVPHKRGYNKCIEMKELLDWNNGFLQNDGSVRVEVDFTVETATLDHIFA